MPFDSTLPLTSSPVTSAELREQFNALKDLCDTMAVQIADLTNQQNSTAAALAGVQAQIPNFVTQADVEPICANNIDAVTELTLTVSNPPLTAEVEDILNKLNEAITGLHR